ncbi:unnamed protein product [Triticum turgidum subsp. durum]|uniref:Uncharacterized protein n=1 Tax=Triticum turgidum subsp. durum TaxID=4567 RepID=A0A9R1RV64_TRITD|nr:unnamed protein product [Triticum turgidum subsp. durum]
MSLEDVVGGSALKICRKVINKLTSMLNHCLKDDINKFNVKNELNIVERLLHHGSIYDEDDSLILSEVKYKHVAYLP